MIIAASYGIRQFPATRASQDAQQHCRLQRDGDRIDLYRDVPGLLAACDAHVEFPVGGQRLWTRLLYDRQPPRRIVPCHGHAHEYAALMLEASAVVFVESERAVRAWIDRQGRWLIDPLFGVLPHGVSRNDRATAHVQRHRCEIDIAIDLAAAV